MLELFPAGFEELDTSDGVELAAYTDASGEEQLWHAFGGARADDVAAGWEDRWRTFHRPVTVAGLWVGPPWETPPPGATAVVIEPARAFGTGAHPTTRLCLELLLDVERRSVVDVGCGSGVLSIAAAKLGHAPVLAVDDDVAAVEAARANALANGVEVEVRRGDVLRAALPEADLALANIDAAALRALAPNLRSGAVIASGYYAVERPELPGWRHDERRERDRWAADLYRRE